MHFCLEMTSKDLRHRVGEKIQNIMKSILMNLFLRYYLLILNLFLKHNTF